MTGNLKTLKNFIEGLFQILIRRNMYADNFKSDSMNSL